MKLHKGNMWHWYEDTNYFVFTGNSYIKNNSALVMGRGMAVQIRDRIPGVDKILGKHMLEKCGHLGLYGFFHVRKIGVFQVKRHFKDKASLVIIRNSIDILKAFAKQNPKKRIHMNYPGIGNGGLTKELVQLLIEELPDNVHIWTF